MKEKNKKVVTAKLDEVSVGLANKCAHILARALAESAHNGSVLMVSIDDLTVKGVNHGNFVVTVRRTVWPEMKLPNSSVKLVSGKKKAATKRSKKAV